MRKLAVVSLCAYLGANPQLRHRLIILLTMVMGGYKFMLSMKPPFMTKPPEPPVSKTGWRKPAEIMKRASLIDANMVEQVGTTVLNALCDFCVTFRVAGVVSSGRYFCGPVCACCGACGSASRLFFVGTTAYHSMCVCVTRKLSESRCRLYYYLLFTAYYSPLSTYHSLLTSHTHHLLLSLLTFRYLRLASCISTSCQLLLATH